MIKHYLFLSASIFLLLSCNNKKSSMNIKSENVSYQDDSVKLSGFVAYDSTITSKRPIILIIHEWWGLNDYVKRRAKQLASLGYLVMAVDMYGNGSTASSVEDAAKMSAPFYRDNEMSKKRFDEALKQIKTYSQADTTKIAAIGYCFGGSMVLNLAKMGEPFKGVVSFHGGLAGIPVKKELLRAKILVCHGADDQFVTAEEVNHFKKEMDSVHADYLFKEYKGATHAFSNPDATEWGKKFNIPIAYNAAADSASWDEMKIFLDGILK